MDVVAATLEHVEHRAVEVAVLLPVGPGRIALDVGLDRLGDVGGAGRDHVLAVERRPAFPRMVARGVHARLLEQLLVDVAVGALERAHEGALARPALPLALLVLGRRRVVARSGRAFVGAGYAEGLLGLGGLMPHLPRNRAALQPGQRMSRQSGYRFAAKDMRQRKNHQMNPTAERSAGKKSPSSEAGQATDRMRSNRPQQSSTVAAA